MFLLRRVLIIGGLCSLVLWLSSMLLTSCKPSAPITVSIVYSAEKKAWLEPLLNEYNQLQSRVRIKGYPTGSVESVRAIMEETSTPTVWSPASSIYIPLVNEEWQQTYGVDLIEEKPRMLLLSPMVIAMWRTMAETLGWPHKQLGWKELSRLVTSEQGWAAYGRAEWGLFKFGHTNPEYSNSGLLSMLAMAYAGADKQGNLTVTDLTNPTLRLFVENILTNVSHYGSSTRFFADSMFHCEEGGVAYLNAAILYENLVIEQERKRQEGLGCAGKQQPIVAIYPTEGTFWADHPYIILKAPWVSQEQIMAARAFETFLLAEPQQRRAMALGFRPVDPTISYVSPLDAAHGVDPAQPHITLAPPSVTVIRELLKLWAAS